MKRQTFAAVALAAIATASCGESGPPTPGDLKDFSAVCDKANDGKRVAVVGYLAMPQSMSGNTSAVLRLYQTPDHKGAPVGVQIRFGAAANQMELPPQQYGDKDLKVHLADGKVADATTKVKISGSVYFPTVGQDFTCALENPLVEGAP